LKKEGLKIAMISVHSNPLGEPGTRDTGGMSVYIREVARRLAERGHAIDIFTRVDRRAGTETVRPFTDTRVIHLPARPLQPLSQFILYRHLAEFFDNLGRFKEREGISYDLVHTHYWLSGQVGRWVRKWWRVPHVFMFHTLGALKNRVFGSEQEPDLRLRVEKQLTAECDLILTGTAREKQHVAEHYGALPQSIRVVPCGVDLECFRPSARRESRIRLGVDRAERVILYVGRFDPIKGVDRLLTAVARLQREIPLRVLLVGGGEASTPEVSALQALCSKLSLQDCVIFAGRRSRLDLADYYRAADVLVLPSYYESFGLVILEALACGTPVVAPPVGVVTDIVRDGINGWIVADNNPESLAEGVRRALKLHKSKEVSADSIRQTVKDYDWSYVAASIDAEYRALIECGRSPGVIPASAACFICGNGAG